MSQQTLFDLIEKPLPLFAPDDGEIFNEWSQVQDVKASEDRPVKYVCLSECIKRRLCWWCAKSYVPDYTPDVDPEPYSIPTPPICAECEAKRAKNADEQGAVS
jgi:hypothetical protein